MRTVKIGEAAKASGVNAKMIRHYEKIGLMPKPDRSDGGYREYDPEAVHHLRFIRRSRDLGFSMKETKQLLGLWRNRSRSSAEVKKLAQSHIRSLETKIDELRAMSDALKKLAKDCHGDQRPECPILADLAES